MPQQPSVPGVLAPLSIARIFWKRKILIGLVWVAVSLATFAAVWHMPAIYMADTLILVDSQKIPERYVASTVSTELQDRLLTINQQILSATRLQKIIDDFGLYGSEKKALVPEEILERMRRDISVQIEAAGTGGRPGAFRIGYEGTNPQVVAQVANRIASLYIEENLKTREVQAEGTSEFIGNQLQDAKKKLDELEEAVSKYKISHNGELPQQENAIGQTLARLQAELESNRDAINRADQSKVLFSSNLATLQSTTSLMTNVPAAPATAAAPASVAPAVEAPRPADPPVSDAQRRIDTLQRQLEALHTRYGDAHPDVRRLKAEIAALQSSLPDPAQAPAVPAPAKAAPAVVPVRTEAPPAAADRAAVVQAIQQIALLKTEIDMADKEIESRKRDQQKILAAMQQEQARMNNLPVREQEMAQLTRDYEISKSNYKTLLDKKLAADMASDMEHRQKSERFEVLDPARVPEKPIRPKRTTLNVMGCAAGLAVGLLLGFGWELKRDLFLGEWEFPKSMVVLARVPRMASAGGPAPAEARPGGTARPLLLRPLIVSSTLLVLVVMAAAAYYVISHKS